MPSKEKIGIIGNGNVGSALKRGFDRAGYATQAVGREPQKVRETAAWADVVVLAVPFGERQNAVREMGDGLRGKILVDATNPIGPAGPQVDVQRSGAEELQAMAQGSRVVKAFNTVFAQTMDSGRVEGTPITILTSGNDEAARRTTGELARAIGFDVLDAGPLENSRWLEALAILNINLAYSVGHGPNMGFRVVRPGATMERAAGASKAPQAARH
jgi:predicted dinucleotide-binding enzyme